MDLNSDKMKLQFTSEMSGKGPAIDNDALDNFGVFSFYTGVYDWSSTTSLPDYMYNREVSRTKIANQWSDWHYSPVMYWPVLGEKLSFYAYAPYATPANKIELSAASEPGLPVLTYQVPISTREQQDILYAEPLFNLQNTKQPVRLQFKHALTKVLFHAKLTVDGGPATGEQLKIQEIRLSSLWAKGAFRIDTHAGVSKQWALDMTKSASYPLTVADGLSNLALTDRYQTVSSLDNFMYLLPQSILENPFATVSIHYGIYRSEERRVGKEC